MLKDVVVKTRTFLPEAHILRVPLDWLGEMMSEWRVVCVLHPCKLGPYYIIYNITYICILHKRSGVMGPLFSWPYNWVTGAITLVIRVITQVITVVRESMEEIIGCELLTDRRNLVPRKGCNRKNLSMMG